LRGNAANMTVLRTVQIIAIVDVILSVASPALFLDASYRIRSLMTLVRQRRMNPHGTEDRHHSGR